MTALTAAMIWLTVVNVIGLLPSRDHHWRAAYVMIALGVPLLVWLIWQSGVWRGLAFVLAAASVLRWPMRYAWRWLRKV
ncbi:MAG: DUF2484 family protein [Microgenomates group bacterium]